MFSPPSDLETEALLDTLQGHGLNLCGAGPHDYQEILVTTLALMSSCGKLDKIPLFSFHFSYLQSRA